MCDTFVSLGNKIGSGNVIFGKNSDREPNEAQSIIRFPARINQEKEIRCTFISIPQEKETFEVILSKPFQMWGAEMGVNEHGLVIGNEAVFTKIGFKKSNIGLTGMDLLRLALERCKSANSALELITQLLEKYGQDVCSGYTDKNFYYHNSFLIADINDAWVLETAGIHWVAVKVEKFRSISNGLTIEEKFDLHSKDLIEFALKKKWLKKGETFNFRKCYSDWFMTKFSYCKMRQSHSQTTGNNKTEFTINEAIEILTSHNKTENFQPSKSIPANICMHATGLTNPSTTVGSMIVELRKDKPITVWLTGTSNPCLSVYKPFFFGNNTLLESSINQPTSFFDNSLWWQAEKFHRKVAKNYQKNLAVFEKEKINLQSSFFEKEKYLIENNIDNLNLEEFSSKCLENYLQKIKSWDKQIIQNSQNYSKSLIYKYFINKINKKAKIEI